MFSFNIINKKQYNQEQNKVAKQKHKVIGLVALTFAHLSYFFQYIYIKHTLHMQ